MLRRALWVLATVACVLPASSALALASHGDEPTPVPDKQVALVYDEEGTLHAAWTEGNPGDETISHATFSEGAWSEPQVAVGEPGPVFDLSILPRLETVCLYWSILTWFRSCLVDKDWTDPEQIARFSSTASFIPAASPDGEVYAAVYEPPSGIFFGGVQLNEGEIVADVRFLIDSSGGYHVVWRSLDHQEVGWRHSSDGGASWTDPVFLAEGRPVGELSLGADREGTVHLVWGFSDRVYHLGWSAGDGWSPVEEVEVATSVVKAVVTPDGKVVVVGRTNAGAFTLARSPGGRWSEPKALAGTEGHNIDQTNAVASPNGDVMVLWHEHLAERYGQTLVTPGRTFPGSVPGPGDVNLDPVVLIATAALTAMTLLLVPFPAALFDNTLTEHHDDLAGWLKRRSGIRSRRRFWDTPTGIISFLVGSALLYGFLDPGFGFNASSLAIFLGLMAGVTVMTIGFSVPILVMRRVSGGEWGRFRALPLALVIGVGCVLLSRAIDFQPGYLYGVVIGIVFAKEVTRNREGAEAVVSSFSIMTLSFAAWVLLSAVRKGGSDFGTMVAEAALVTVVVAGIEALAVGLLPVRGLPGQAAARWNKAVWLALWGISLVLFFHVLINPESGYLVDTALVPLSTTVGLVIVFSLVSVAMWGYFALRDRRQESQAKPNVVP